MRNLPRRQVEQIFPLDEKHMPLIARLIAAKQLYFPEHTEILTVFFKTLAQSDGIHNGSFLRSALVYLATESSVPGDFQMLARVEQSKLSSRQFEPIAPFTKTSPTRKTSEQQMSRTPLRTTESDIKNPVIDEILPMKLRLD